MKINIVVPRLARKKFSGGILCIFEYAHGLAQRGHEVTVVPMLPCRKPEWFPKPVGRILSSSRKDRIGNSVTGICNLIADGIRSFKRPEKHTVRKVAADLCLTAPAAFPIPLQMGLAEYYVREVAPAADVNLAVTFETAGLVSMLPGTGCYFAQHFEPYFRDDYPDPKHAEWFARQSYKLGLNLIANSTWLQQKLLHEYPNIEVGLCPNAIDHNIFKGSPRKPGDSRQVVVISYGGREARWKGFPEMVEAMAIVRHRLKEITVDWRVYGDALIPPDNPVAPYTSLGFLPPARLAEQYRNADILLSASWYESFPLFPIEAMASGIAVITTQAGTEEYAIPSVTAEVVEARNPSSIADGLIRLIQDREHRYNIACRGNLESQKFTWTRSVDQMEQLLAKAFAASKSAHVGNG